MHRLNLTIDEELFERARAVSFLEKKSISEMIRESLGAYLESRSKLRAQASLVLEAEDEQELMRILKEDTFSSESDFKNRFGL